MKILIRDQLEHPEHTAGKRLNERDELHPGRTYPEGRRCERFDCITILCRYNKGPACWAHTYDEFRPRVSAA